MLELLYNIDNLLFEWINQSIHSLIFDDIMPILRNKKTWIPLYISIAFFLLYRYRLRGFVIILLGIVTIGIADQISSQVLKEIFERVRPCNNPNWTTKIRLLIDCSSGYSFPSSHAANHFALASFFAFLFAHKRIISLIGILWASIISFAQIYVGVHYPSDIIAGALLGMAIGWLVALFCKKALSRLSLW